MRTQTRPCCGHRGIELGYDATTPRRANRRAAPGPRSVSGRTRVALQALFAVAVASVAVVGWSAGALPSIDEVRAAVVAAGAAGPLVYVPLYALATVAAVPGGPLTILSGVLFGPVLGTGVALAGASVGATLAFGLARALGRSRTHRLLRGRLERLDTWVSDRGFVTILTLRFIPVVPFNVLNYAAGLSGVGIRAYVPATVFGIAPGTFAYAALGGTASDPLSAPFLGAVALVVALVGIGAFARRRLFTRHRLTTAPEAASTPLSNPQRQGQDDKQRTQEQQRHS